MQPHGLQGAALASQLDIDLGVESYFKNSQDESKYGSVRIQPQSFQDDILRVAPNLSSARSGNVKMHMMLSERLLQCHPKKTCCVLYGGMKFKEQIRGEMKLCPLKFGDFHMTEKFQDVYLGDILSSDGLSASVEATVDKRISKVRGSMYAAAAILKDYRMQAIGGMMGAWDIWEMSIVPQLLANCGSWVEISRRAIKQLEETQNLFCRLVYSCPSSTPMPSLRGKAGLTDMEHCMWLEKVCLVTSVLFNNEEQESYARELLQEQLARGWPGLTQEVKEICRRIGLPNACKQYIPRKQVLEQIKLSSLKKVKEDMEGLTKLESIKNEDLRQPQKYMRSVSLEDSRLEFRWRTGMLDNRGCMGKRYRSKACPHCPAGRVEGQEETSAHWLSCQAYEGLRIGLDPEGQLEDRVKYIRRVQEMRKLLELTI